MVFMVGGYDTTATALCWLAYDLATNPDVQERLIKEIDSEIGQVGCMVLDMRIRFHLANTPV